MLSTSERVPRNARWIGRSSSSLSSMNSANGMCTPDENDPPNQIQRQSHSSSSQGDDGLSPLAVSIRDRIRNLIELHSLSSSDTAMALPIVVSVSGGCDSVALFHALTEWNECLQKQQARLQLDIEVVHFHHRQRPLDADQDCRLVRDLVANVTATNSSRTMAFRLEDWKDLDATDGAFSQDKARAWRRTKLSECAQERLDELRRQQQQQQHTTAGSSTLAVPFGVILTAHHEDDSYETVLIKLLRGVHVLNLHDKATIQSIAPIRSGNDSESSLKKRENDLYLVRPFVTDNTPYNSDRKPLPGHTKEDMLEYLLERNLPWREDASNHDPNSKYLRNRVRNELIPLLKDLTGDSFRTKRVPALLEQSRDLKEEVEPRVEAYLSAAVLRTKDDEMPLFSILTETDGDTNYDSRLVRTQALYEWMSRSIEERQKQREDDSESSNLSYDSLKRVVKQLDRYPDRRKWTLELGSRWAVQRVGDVLRLEDNAIGSSKDKKNTEVHWEWSVVSDDDDDDEDENETDSIRICLSREFLDERTITFVSTTLATGSSGSGKGLRFVPPWKQSPVKLRAFLRGQKIPGHLREETPLLFAVVGEEKECHRQLVAVRVGEKWIVDHQYVANEESSSSSENIVLRVYRG